MAPAVPHRSRRLAGAHPAGHRRCWIADAARNAGDPTRAAADNDLGIATSGLMYRLPDSGASVRTFQSGRWCMVGMRGEARRPCN
ncbi:hypothetical protein CUJ87_09530 [Paraburkholderia caledonica]|nr:hypothetical protein CUJ87_09530 [Paraburkholderia caledonica]